jgi:hypothetical protein
MRPIIHDDIRQLLAFLHIFFLHALFMRIRETHRIKTLLLNRLIVVAFII